VSAANGYREVAKFLLSAAASINLQDDYGYTPLHLAAKFNHVSYCFADISKFHHDCNIVGEAGTTSAEEWSKSIG